MATFISPRTIKKMDAKTASYRSFEDAKKFEKIGMFFSDAFKRDVRNAFSDAASSLPLNFSPTGQTTPSIGVPLEKLRVYDPEFIRTLTTPTTIDNICGIKIIGDFFDQEIAQGIVENVGRVVLYGDRATVPTTSENLTFMRRTIFRFLSAMSVGFEEEGRAAKANLSLDKERRQTVALALELCRNRIGFYGYNIGKGATYGIVNDPNLLPAITVPKGASGSTSWKTKTVSEIEDDLLLLFSAMIEAFSGWIDDTDFPDASLTLPTGITTYLNRTAPMTNDMSVFDWLKKRYPKVRVRSCPEFVGANGGENIAKLVLDEAPNGGGSTQKVVEQLIPAKMMALGIEKKPRVYTEEYAAAYAGVALRKPMGVQTLTGF